MPTPTIVSVIALSLNASGCSLLTPFHKLLWLVILSQHSAPHPRILLYRAAMVWGIYGSVSVLVRGVKMTVWKLQLQLKNNKIMFMYRNQFYTLLKIYVLLLCLRL
jgi:hypothetical protein